MARRRILAAGALFVMLAVIAVPAPVSMGQPTRPELGRRDVRSPLGNGLGRLLAEQAKSTQRQGGGIRLDQSRLAIQDRDGRVMVDLTPQAGADRTAFRSDAVRRGLVITATDSRHGILEGYAAPDAIRALSAMDHLGTLAQVPRPSTNIGAATSQGVLFQRVDKVLKRGIDGRGITVGVLSDSYDTATTDAFGNPLSIHAAQDVASGDLPGPGNATYPQSVTVLQDYPGGLDEGRAMLQIIHDIAPAAKLCFATAEGGSVGLANNIRRLADKSGQCGADVIVDDITYFDEPMFSDGVIADAIDDVAAQGVHYFSSAGNNGDAAAWQSRARLIPAPSALQGTNLDLTGVSPALYDGGLQDMDPGPGTDVAQTLVAGAAGGVLDVQWDDPVDLDGATFGEPYFADTGEITATAPEATFVFTATQDQVGRTVRFRTDAIPSGTTDLILSVTAPDGTSLGTIDTGSSPEVLVTTLESAGPYTITITGFGGDTGDFTVDVAPVLSPSRVTTDYNLLFFDMAGKYLGSSADQNRYSGRPLELAGIAGSGEVQLAIGRSGTGPVGATRLRSAIINADVRFTEYSDVTTPSIVGHPTAVGATAVGAYDPFRPYLPEAFTSAGGRLPIFFDSSGHRYAKPSIRQVPQISSTDGVNTTFFVDDSVLDADAQPNFFGTSASAPHAAAIAALALQRRGGPGSITPAALRRHLERSTFAHDLDPGMSRGRSGGLIVIARGAQSPEASAIAGSMIDPRFFALRYDGRVPLRSVTFLGETASPTAPGPDGRSDGIVFDPRPFDGVSPFIDDGFPFTVGRTAGGLRAKDVRASFSVPGGTQTGQFRHLTIRFASGLGRGQSLAFGVDRDLAFPTEGYPSSFGNGADELGGATFLPSGRRGDGGLQFVATRIDGSTFRGVMKNRLGTRFSPLDGYGMVNAERAVLGLRPGPTS